ncbi:hypothetical protein FISHEDRAFT_31473, partial [Fistulina hepatica ATCC 64428]
VFDELVLDLSKILSENLVLAALDLIDRDSIVKYSTPWGHIEYSVAGSTSSYSVFLGLSCPMSYFCSCPSFSYSVSCTGKSILCKHILAARLAEEMSMCIERTGVSDDELALL